MSTKTGKISIVIPIYKVETELERCVQSVINQTYRNIEIILVDDGSPDMCPKMCDDYAEKDDRIIVVHKENGGLSDARNAGLRVASGEYVLYIDSDDYVELDACERLLAGMRDGVDFVVGVCKEKRGEKTSYQKHSNIDEKKVYAARDFAIESIKNSEWYAPAWLNLYNRDFLLENDLFYKEGYIFEDHEMLIRLFLAANQVVYVDYPFYNYVVRTGSIMTSENLSLKQDMTVKIYSEWLNRINNVKDGELQRYLFGALVKYYMAKCRDYKIIGWVINGLSFKFAWKYGLNYKEKIKILVFSLMPRVYVNLRKPKECR